MHFVQNSFQKEQTSLLAMHIVQKLMPDTTLQKISRFFVLLIEKFINIEK